MKKENKKQVVVFHLMGKSVENKALSSAGCPIRSGMTECAETGRSMVEMLGVLAIMGVLSVGGVSMYSSAMSKHRANELLNEASKRAAIVARQITAGKTGTDLSIDKFTNPTGYKFYVDKTYTAGGKTFKLTLSKDPSGAIDENICTQMKAALGDNAAMAIDDTCATITFNADMGKDVKMPGVSTPDGYTGDDGSDCSGDTKLGTANSCQVCVNGAYIDSDAKCDKDKNQVCLDGVCTTPTDNGRTGCTRNSDCKGMQNGIDCNSKTCYCNYYNYRTGRMRDGSCTGGATKGSGVCMEAIFEETTVDDDGIKGKLSTEYMDWFSAKNFCAALG
ncbi:MAG: type II secretion system protein, partial [Alphaproteobacteria bacterium]